MHRLFEALRPFIRGVVRRAWVVLAVALLLTAGSLLLAQHLRIDTDFSKLLPSDYASVEALERLRETVGGESSAAVGIQSPSFEANRAFAEDLIDRVVDGLRGEGYAEPYFGRVDFYRDIEFLQDNALYFASEAELTQLEDYLDARIEEARLEANPFYFELDDEDLDEEGADLDSVGQALQQSYEQIVGREYPVSDDSTTLVVHFYPTGSQTDLQFIEDAYADLEGLIERMDPQGYHPEMEVTTAGRLLRQLVEVQAITGDVARSFGAGVGTVLLMVTLYFFYKAYRARAGRRFDRRILLQELPRAPVLALVIGLPLIMSLAWTFGVAYLAFETLNLMTATLGLVLFGLGIDFGIHFYARYAEERGEGQDVLDAAETTFVSTGQAIAIGALTTAAALYVLTLADFRGFSEFGFIAGTGVLFALGAMTVVLPALLSLLERYRLLDLTAHPAVDGVDGRPRGGRVPAARGLVAGSLVAVVVALVLMPRVGFEYRFGELEPEYEAYERRDDVIDQVSTGGGGRNPAYIIVDDRREVPAVVAALRERAAADTLTPTIRSVESLQERFPLEAGAQEERLARIAEIREMLDDPFIRQEESEELDRLRRGAQTREPVALAEVPAYLREQFTSKTGEVGNFVIVYPSVGLSHGRRSMEFADDVGTLVVDGRTYHAGSTSLVAADMLRLMLDEAPWMVLGTFLIVLLLMYLNFRSVRWAALAVVPLVVGVLWMLLVMELTGLKLNFYNLVVLPAVLGIGNDAGVHLVHRYREEGFGSIRDVLRSTGEHVTMGSLTTMVGFAGLLLSFHPGLESIGLLAVVGIGATLLSALLFLPALLQSLEDRGTLHGAAARPEPVAPLAEEPVG